MALKKYNKILTSGRCYTKEPKDAHIISAVGVAQKIMYSNNTSDKYNRE